MSSRRREKGTGKRAQAPAKSGGGPPWIGIGVAVLALAGIGAFVVLRQEESDPIPVPDLSQLEAPLARAIEPRVSALRAAPDSVAHWRELGAIYDANTLYPYAETCYREVLRREPGDVRTQYQLALVIDYQHNETDEPLELLRGVAALNPDYPPVFFHLGRMYEARGNLAGAREAYETTIRLDPELGLGHRSLGQVLLAQGDAQGAVNHLEQALQLFGRGDSPSYASLAQAQHRLGNEDKARKCVELSTRYGTVLDLPDPLRYEVTSKSTTSVLAFGRARSRIAAGDFAGAIGPLKIVVEAKPDHVNAHMQLAKAYRATNQTALAERHFQRVQELERAGSPISAGLRAEMEAYVQGGD